MYWSEETKQAADTPPCSMVDVSFRLKARELPADHGAELRDAILEHLPWFGNTPGSGLHPIVVAPSANGWLRPEAGDTELMQLSKRTRMMLRVPTERGGDCAELEHKTLVVRSCSLEVGRPKVRQLSPSSTLFSRHVRNADAQANEDEFLEGVADELRALGIEPRKLLVGMRRTLGAHTQAFVTRSVLVAELRADESLTLQCRGIGEGRAIGCGMFIAHKDIAPVHAEHEERD